ncbi:MAG: dihydrofolate reductase [Bacteroidales bacterium]|nr:dihydrofolate reductase [Bacteroidales bacterium]
MHEIKKTGPILSIIVAIAQNNAIGKDNQLLWHISNDLKRFKRLTAGHSVIMGKRTLFSLPSGPLPKRRNIVLSDKLTDCFGGGCETAYSIEDALKKIENETEVFIIGGGQVYEQFLPIADKLYLTIVEKDFDADTFFSEINFSEWELIEKEIIQDDSSVDFSYRYETWIRRR